MNRARDSRIAYSKSIGHVSCKQFATANSNVPKIYIHTNNYTGLRMSFFSKELWFKTSEYDCAIKRENTSTIIDRMLPWQCPF